MAAKVEAEINVANESAQPEASAASRPRLIWWLWGARGFFGGSLAILLAWLGQQQISTEPPDAGLVYYLAAIVLLVLTLSRFGLNRKEKVAQKTETVSQTSDEQDNFVTPSDLGRDSVAQQRSSFVARHWPALAGLAVTLLLAG